MAQPAIALANMAGIPPPNPLGANIAGAQGQGQAGHPQPLAQAPPHQLNVQPAPNPFVRCVKFLACWDCGPVGTIIAAAAFAAGTVISYYTFKLAIWTATKDYIEHCQSDEENQRATPQCQQALSQELAPPPFYKYNITPRNTLYHRTVGGVVLGATEYTTHSNFRLWICALVFNAFCWCILSKICRLALDVAATSRRSAEEVYLEGPTAIHGARRSATLMGSDPLEHRAEASSSRAIPNYGNFRRRNPRPRKGSQDPGEKQVQIPKDPPKVHADKRKHVGRLLKQNPNCPLRSNPESALNRLRVRGRVSDIPKPLQSFSERNYSQRAKKKFQHWREKLTQSKSPLPRNLCGLEISACSGNVRRISLVDIMVSSQMKFILESFAWNCDAARVAIMEASEKQSAEAFNECYEQNPDWREDIDGVIDACLDYFKYTGIDNAEHSLTALYMIYPGEPVLVEFPNSLYNWIRILEDPEQFFTCTMAIITDTCLVMPDFPQPSNCTESTPDIHGSFVLETQLHIQSQSARFYQAKDLIDQRVPGKQILLKASRERPSGILEIMVPLDVEHKNVEFLFATFSSWTIFSPFKLNYNTGNNDTGFTCVECLDQVNAANSNTTYIYSTTSG